jgi:hypothetical protein
MCQAIDYSLVVEVVIDFLPTCLRSRQVCDCERDNHGSITRTNDTTYCIIVDEGEPTQLFNKGHPIPADPRSQYT